MWESIKNRFPDKGALAGAIALSCISVLAIPFIYLLIVRSKRKANRIHQSTLKEFSRAKSEGRVENTALPLKREKER